MKRRGAAVAASLALLTSCGRSEVEGTKVCRRYPTALTQGGQPYQCTFDVRFLRCTGSATTVWEYSGPEAFVLEPQVPSRILAVARSVSAGGPLLVSSSHTQTDYRYDSSGRLVERRRRITVVTGTIELDVLEYTAWDSFGRPSAATLRAEDRTAPVSIRYDDAARRMEASNGEAVTRDSDGNIVREVFVFGFGAPFAVDTIIQSTSELCL